ncbi:response regulator transcription factor [Yoonia sp.]|uniref:response regulator transcription factor n=1 Tax=Yoonia sp. TaxID=2212373 RepID=UPI003A4DDB49
MEILLVEDEARVADFLVRGLQAEGYSVQWVKNGRLGLAAAEVFAKDCAQAGTAGVMILDIMLPELDGLTLCQMLRQRGVQLPILMLSAMGETSDRVDGLRRGADDYLPKPFEFDELLARIEALMRRAKQPQQEKASSIGMIALDRDLPGLRAQDQEVPLTLLELSLIELLLAAEGKTVSRERILSRVWQTSRDPLTNIVDVYISRLRRKLQKLDSSVTILNVRGLGYRITQSRP